MDDHSADLGLTTVLHAVSVNPPLQPLVARQQSEWPLVGLIPIMSDGLLSDCQYRGEALAKPGLCLLNLPETKPRTLPPRMNTKLSGPWLHFGDAVAQRTQLPDSENRKGTH